MSIPLCLSHQGLANIALEYYPSDFVFKVGKKKYECPGFLADFLSPRISRTRATDLTINFYRVESQIDTSIFDKFISLAYGKTVEIQMNELRQLTELAVELENKELYESILSSATQDDITAKDVVLRLILKHSMGTDCTSEITFCVNNFSEISLEHKMLLPIDVLEDILSNDQLKTDTEDSISMFIRTLCRKDPGYGCLFAHVCFENLTAEEIDILIDEHPGDILNSMNIKMWEKLCRRLRHTKFIPTQMQGEMRPYTMKRFPLNNARPLDGIIAYLTRKCGGNVADMGVVDITADAPYDNTEYNAAKNIADLEENTYFGTANKPDVWVCYDFKDSSILLQAYSLRSNCSDNWNMKGWKIEVSMDGTDWQEVDRRETKDLLQRNVTKSYVLTEPVECRYVKLTQIGRNNYNSYEAAISSFELFGELHSEKW